MAKKDGQSTVPVVPAETSKAVATEANIPKSNIPHIGKQDFIVAKILVQQDTSEKVKTQEAKRGEFRDTVENKIFGSSQHPLEFIPLLASNFWVEYDVTSNPQGSYLGQYDVTATNEGQPREVVVDGKKLKRVQTIECFILIPEEVKAGIAFPYVLSFRMTSLRAGRTLLTQLRKNEMFGKPAYGNVCELSCTEESNDKGDYFVQRMKPKRASTAEELVDAAKWAGVIGQGAVVVDNSDLKTGGGEDTMKDVKTDQF